MDGNTFSEVTDDIPTYLEEQTNFVNFQFLPILTFLQSYFRRRWIALNPKATVATVWLTFKTIVVNHN